MADERKYYPAFPVTAGQQVYANGMTLRDWFAGQALAGMASIALDEGEMLMGWRDMSKAAYHAADAMLQARQKGGDA